VAEPSPALRLIVGLGNPGPQYEHTRHNAGCWLVDALARHHGGSFRMESKFSGEVCQISVAGHLLWLLSARFHLDAVGFHKVQGVPFRVVEIRARIAELLGV